MPRVRFIDVGRSKLTWEADLKNVDEATLVLEIKKKKALMSRDVEVRGCVIYVGGFRAVGRMELLKGVPFTVARG